MSEKEIVKVDTFRGLKSLIPQEKTIEFNGVQINVKQYLDIDTKNIIIKSIQGISFLKDETGVDSYDQMAREVGLVYLILKHYTNINLPKKDDNNEIYNIAVGSGLYDEICSAIPYSELDFIECQIDDYIDLKLKELSNRSQIVEQLKVLLEESIDKMPNEAGISNVIKELSNLSGDKLKLMSDIASINKSGK